MQMNLQRFPAKDIQEPDSWIQSVLGGIYALGEMPKDCALDLGAGNLRHSRMFVKFGFKKVIAVDTQPTEPNPPESQIEVRRIDMRAFRSPAESLDAVLWWNSAYLFTPTQIRDILQRVRTGLRSGGIFIGTFAVLPKGLRCGLTSFPRSKIESALQGLTVIADPAPIDSGERLPPGLQILRVIAHKG